MILQLRHGKTVFEVEVPSGARLQASTTGQPILVLPGPRSEDTSTWIPAPEIIDAARLGWFGLALRSERRIAQSNRSPRPQAAR